jgi:hypothetical protein
MRQIRIQRPAGKTPAPEPDLRTPSGKPLPY